tara:strand:- start:1586 stop:2272 length:687 start_codon:yes stop_codon:yes gene_type:complete
MGYLDNSSITVDAILTKRGRELLAQSHRMNPQDINNRFRITQFALGDDEIDYSLFNENHPNGTQYSSEAIENMPLIEAIPNGANSLNSKLITLTRGANAIPYIDHAYGSTGITLTQGGQVTIEVTTYNLNGSNASSSEEYIWTILDSRLRDTWSGTGATSIATAADISEFSTIAHSQSVRGTKVILKATTSNALFSSTITSRTTSVIVEGVTSGAIKTIPITINSTTG